MNELKSGKEDIEGKIRANANTHKFLEDELQSLNHKLGLKRIEINEVCNSRLCSDNELCVLISWANFWQVRGFVLVLLFQWQKKAHDSALENKELAKKMHDIDMKLNEELQNKQVCFVSTASIGSYC